MKSMKFGALAGSRRLQGFDMGIEISKFIDNASWQRWQKK
jgi:hypothetical protein